MIIYVFVCAVILLMSTNIIGRLWIRKWVDYKYSFSLSTCMGLVTIFAVFHLIAVPAIYCKMKLSALTVLSFFVFLCLIIVSCYLNRKEWIEYYKKLHEKLKYLQNGKDRIWCYIVILLVIGQTLFAAFTYTGHEDDNRYVAAIVDAYESDEMLMYHPMTGEYLGEVRSELKKDAIAPILMFWGVLCKIFRIHPATFVHVVVPLFMIPLCYSLYYIIARKLTEHNIRKTAMFIIAFWLFNVMNHYTPGEGIGRMLFYMRWGKSILCAFLIPLLIFILMELMEDTQLTYKYNLITFVAYGGCLATVMSPVLLPFIIGLYAVCDCLRKKTVRRFFRLIVCTIPALCYGILYYIYA